MHTQRVPLAHSALAGQWKAELLRRISEQSCAGLDICGGFSYNIETGSDRSVNRLIRLSAGHSIRACTGFDGGFEVWEAIRGPGTASTTWNLKLNADENLAYAA